MINIGVISRLTGLSQRQIRYYEQRKLISPYKSDGSKSRKYSLTDIDILLEISEKIQRGYPTNLIRKEFEN